MNYKINGFLYDDISGEFTKNDGIIQLTKTLKNLLNYFINNPHITISKQELMSHVWGRDITENSVEKAISKLRACIEDNPLKPTVLVTHFGHGISFDAKIVKLDSKDFSNNKTTYKTKKLIALASLIFIILIIGLIYKNNLTTLDPLIKNREIALFVPEKGDWLSSGSANLLENIIASNSELLIKDHQQKPKNLSDKQFIQYQWKLTPDLKIIRSKVNVNQGLYSINISITSSNGNKTSTLFSDTSYNNVIKSASSWLMQNFNLNTNKNNFNNLLPENNFTMEIYLRGLEKLAKGELKNAGNYFDICMNENPNFLPAYLKMAYVNSKQEKLSQAMTIIDTLSQLKGYQNIQTEAQILKARLFMQLNQQVKAQNYLESVIDNSKSVNGIKINQMQTQLSSIYINLNKSKQALALLSDLENKINIEEQPELLQRVYYNKGRIFNDYEQYENAEKYIFKSKSLNLKLGNLFAESADLRLLSRISKNLGKKHKVAIYLNNALAISKSLKDNIGVAKTISFMVPNLIKEGKFKAALKLNQEMENIVAQFNSNMGSMYAKLNYAAIAKHQKHYKKADIYLRQHFDIVSKAKNNRGLLSNYQNQTNLLLAQNKTDGLKELIDKEQELITKGNLKNLQVNCNIKLVRYYFLTNQDELANKLLIETKKLAINQQNNEKLASINILIAQRYLKAHKAGNALSLLDDKGIDYSNHNYAYLMLLSKIYFQLKQPQKALKLAHECKTKVNEYWTIEDQQFLNKVAAQI